MSKKEPYYTWENEKYECNFRYKVGDWVMYEKRPTKITKRSPYPVFILGQLLGLSDFYSIKALPNKVVSADILKPVPQKLLKDLLETEKSEPLN